MSRRKPRGASDSRPHPAPTLRDVARMTGLSVSTVSRALAGHRAISEATTARVRKAAETIGYQPNMQARALRSNQSTIIGLAIPSLTNPYFAELADAVHERALECGFTVVLGTTKEDPDQVASVLRGFLQLQARGLIVVPHDGMTEVLTGLDVPAVLVDRRLPGGEIPCVDSDPTPGMRAAMDVLCEAGHTRIGYIAGPATTSTGRDRLAAFTSSCTDATEGVVAEGGYSHAAGRRASAELLDAGCTAIIAGDSMMTVGVLEAFLGRGIVVGEDIALVGFDDFPLFALQPHPLTVIDQNVRTMGVRALDVLLGQEEPTRVPTHLILRDSTRSIHEPGEH